MIDSTGSRREGRAALPGGFSADHLDPMLVREYRRLLRSPVPVVALLGLHAIALLISLLPDWLLRYFPGGFELIGFLGMLQHRLLSNLSMNAIVIGGSAYGSVVGRVTLIIGCLIVRQSPC